MDAEGELISAALGDEASFMMAMNRSVTLDHFTDEGHIKVWDYMCKHFNEHGYAPTIGVVQTAYPSYTFEPATQPVSYYINVLADRRAKSTLYAGIQEAATFFNEEEGPGVTGAMRATLLQAVEQSSLEAAATNRVGYSLAIRNRIKEWQAGGSGLGITYGFPTLDHHTSGIRPEQFIVFTGLPKSKKSWTLLFVASTVHVCGFPVLFYTFEMSNDDQLQRLATLWGKVPQYVMQQHQPISPVHARDLRRALNIRDSLPAFIGVGDPTATVSAIAAAVKQTGAKVVFIDGIYLMTDERSGQMGHEGTVPLTSISRDLKQMAKAQKIAVVATTQTLPNKAVKGRTGLFTMGYTSAFSQDADVVVGIDPNENANHISIMRIHGNRHGMQNIEFQVEWDLDNGLVEEIDLGFNNTSTGASYGNTNAGSSSVPGGSGTPTGKGDQGWGGHGSVPSASLSPGT